jgi:hypothetical protein
MGIWTSGAPAPLVELEFELEFVIAGRLVSGPALH